MNAKSAVNSVSGLICFAVLILLFWWSKHHPKPHDKNYVPPTAEHRINVYDHEVCRNQCPVSECTTEVCLNLYNEFAAYETADENCNAFWQWFEVAQAADALPDSFYLCGHGKTNQWETQAAQDAQYNAIYNCNWGPSCSQV